MHQTRSAPMALLALLMLTLEVSKSQSCPRSCNCYQANEVHCTFRSLLTIPSGLPSHTRRMNLGFNSISRLNDKSLVGLKRVELLMLHSNDLQRLPDGVFKDMKSLQILKLSYNKLKEISSSLTFSGLTSLLRLYLDHNLLQHIHPRALLQLPSLRLLRLQGNRLHQLHPHTLCTLSFLNTYYISTVRHLDLSNNSLTTLPKECVTTAPLLETLFLQANPWSCDCRMKWFLSWSLAHPGVLKCPGVPQCPVCASPPSLQGQGLFDQTALLCISPIINSPGKEAPLKLDLSEIQPRENFRELLGKVFLGLSDQHGYSVDLSCNISHSADSLDIAPPPDISWNSPSPLSLALSLSLDCPVVGQSYEKIWRILAYYSETAARLEREIMLSKAPALAYRYRQAPDTDGYYHTDVKVSVKARPEWLLQSAISIQLDRAQSNRHKVKLIYTTRVSARPDATFYPSLSSPIYHPWVMILANYTNTAVPAVAGRNIQLSCPVLSSSNPSVQWILPDGFKLNTLSSSLDGRLQVSASGLLVQRVQLSDRGLYYCVARAGRDFDVLPLRLAVEESSVPYLNEISGQPVTGTIGEAVTLTCRISGSPEPLASWILPDGNVVLQGLAVLGGSIVHSNGSLSLHISTLKDTGYYRCIAVNQYGSDSISMQLILKAQHVSALETSFPRGPQSAAGRSTKIPAPIFQQIDEGSGDEDDEVEQKTSSGKRIFQTSLQQRPNRQYPIKKPQRHSHVRKGHLKRLGGPTSLTGQKKQRFQNRHRLTTKKHRIDPQKWADLLAKIRQKTTNSTHSQIIAGGKPTTEPIHEGKDKQMREKGKDDDTNKSIAHSIQEEPETEGSSVDDTKVKEEQPQLFESPYEDTKIIKGKKQITEESTFNSTPAPTQSTTMLSEAHVLENDNRTFTHAVKAHTATQTTLGKHAERLPNKHSKELETNVLGESHLSITHSFTAFSVPSASSTTTSASKIMTASSAAPERASYFGSSKSTPASMTNEDTLLTTTPNAIISPTMSPSTPINIPVSSTPRQISALSTSMTSTSTMPTSCSTTSSILTSTTTFRPVTTWLSITSNPSSSKSSATVLIKAIPKTSSPTFATASRTKTTILTTTESAITRTSPTTTNKSTVNTPLSTTTTIESTSTKALPRDKEVTGHFDHQVNGQNRSQTPTDWKYHGANTIPDSHRSRFHRPPLSIPASPRAPVLRSRPRIPDPHIRTMSVPAESTARLACGAQGEPKPSITWTKVTTGAVMSIHSRAQRFEVLPNGTLVIQNVQVQDRGAYICSASSFLGRDRLLTMLEVRTRPPHMQLMTYREVTIHQGGQVHLECKADGVPAPLLSWVLPNRSTLTSTVTSSNRISMDTNGTLHISVTLPTDRGVYRCVASNSAGAASASVRLHVSSLPPVIQQPREEHLLFAVGWSVYAHCSARGAPTPTLRWRIPDGTLVRPSQFLHGNLFVLPNGTLHIRNFGSKDAGSYECTASNAVGTSRRTVRVEVEDGEAKDKNTSSYPASPFTKARIVSTSPSISTVNYGGTLNLNCSVTGHPTPTIIWRTPTRKLVDMHYSFDQRLKVHPDGTLSVQTVTEKDSGDYLCITRNKVADDFRILRVSVATKPPKIEPKQPVNQMVSFGKPLKVDCQAYGLPHPNVRWKLPNGTTVSSVLFEEDSRGRRQQLTVFDNGTLLVPAVGVGEEGEYMCYAENQAGQDTMKVIVKAIKRTPPSGTDDRSQYFIKVRQGETVTIPCQIKGDPAPTITWISPDLLVIPQSVGSGLYSERIVVVSNGTLEVRSAQRTDSGNYTCQASNSVGMQSMVVSLEVETSSHRNIGQVEKGLGWSVKRPDSNHGTITARTIKFGSNAVIASEVRNNNSYSDNSEIRNIVPNSNVNSVFSGSNPTLRSYSQHGFKSPVQGFTTQQGSAGIRVGANEAQNTGIKIDSTALNRKTPRIQSRTGNLEHSQSTGRGESAERNPEMNSNEVIAGKRSNDVNTSSDNSRLTGISTNGQSIRISLSSTGAGTSTLRGYVFSRNSHSGETSDNRKNNVSSSGNLDTAQGGGTTIKQRAAKGQTVTLPCPYKGHSPLRLVWLLPGNGILPAPYYGSRITVHRNGSLEFRDVRVSDGGTLICIAKTERGDTLMRVQLAVSDPWLDVRSQQDREVENIPLKVDLNVTQSLLSRTVSPLLDSRSGPGLPGTAHSINSPPSSGSVSKPTINTRTAPLVSTINGETLRLLCPASQPQGSISWTMPSGKMLSRGDSGDLGRYVVEEDGTLIIKQVSVFDRGSYTCRFSSHDSSSLSVITVPVIVIAYPPRITIGPSPVTYTTGGVAVELPCLTIATPRATVTWETPILTQLSVMGQPRIYGNLYLSPQGSLVIQNPTQRDTGFYRCIAKNVIGVDSKATYLHVM